MEALPEKPLLKLILNLALAIVILAVFHRVLHHPISGFDDNAVLTNNEPVHNGITWTSIRWAFTTGHFANWMPITWLSHLIDMQLYGLEKPWGHHLTNVLLRVATAWLNSSRSICRVVMLTTAGKVRATTPGTPFELAAP